MIVDRSEFCFIHVICLRCNLVLKLQIYSQLKSHEETFTTTEVVDLRRGRHEFQNVPLIWEVLLQMKCEITMCNSL